MNSHKPIYPWRSKNTLKDHLASLVRELDATIRRVPGSDWVVEVIRDDMCILVAIKESRAQKMWVDAKLFTDRLLEQTYKGGFILLIDHWAQRLLVLPREVLLVAILVRKRRGRAFHESFHVDRVSSGSGYEVRVLPGTTGISVEHINTLEPVLATLRPESSP